MVVGSRTSSGSYMNGSNRSETDRRIIQSYPKRRSGIDLHTASPQVDITNTPEEVAVYLNQSKFVK